MAGDAKSPYPPLSHAERILPLSSADLYDGSQIRNEYSAALNQARIKLLAGADHDGAMKQIDQVERMLDQYEKNGGRHFCLYALRADVHALRGEKDKAAAELK